MSLKITLNVHELTERMDVAAIEMMKGLRGAVDRTARASRREAIKVAAEDIGVSRSLAGKDQPTVRGTTQGRLSASWTVKPVFVNITKVEGASLLKGLGLEASTYRITGGSSAHLHATRAFALRSPSGGTLAMVARDPGAKRTHRGGIRSMSAEITRASMGQDDGAAGKEWKKFGERELTRLAFEAVQSALNGRRASTEAGQD